MHSNADKKPLGIHFKVTPEGSSGPDVVPRAKPHPSCIPRNPPQQDDFAIFSFPFSFSQPAGMCSISSLRYPSDFSFILALLLLWRKVCLGHQALEHPSCELRWAAALVVCELERTSKNCSQRDSGSRSCCDRNGHAVRKQEKGRNISPPRLALQARFIWCSLCAYLTTNVYRTNAIAQCATSACRISVKEDLVKKTKRAVLIISLEENERWFVRKDNVGSDLSQSHWCF